MIIEPALVISSISLVVSILTLAFTHLRRPKIQLVTGSAIGINHKSDGYTIYLPITFINPSATPGVVSRCGILIKNANEENYNYMEWVEFRTRSAETRSYGHNEIAGPLYVLGKASVSKIAWFRWRLGKRAFPAGTYSLLVFVWTSDREKVKFKSKHEFYISEDQAKEIAELQQEDSSRITWAAIDKKIEGNKVLTKHEASKVLA